MPLFMASALDDLEMDKHTACWEGVQLCLRGRTVSREPWHQLACRRASQPFHELCERADNGAAFMNNCRYRLHALALEQQPHRRSIAQICPSACRAECHQLVSIPRKIANRNGVCCPGLTASVRQ